jgi:uroporphyrinogen-III synthase
MKHGWKRDLKNATWIAFTSGAGVRALLHAVGDIRKLAAKKIAVVGSSTAEICQKNGLGVDFVGPGPGAMSLAKHWPGKKDQGVLHCTGGAEEGVLVGALQKRGFSVKRILMYRNIAPTRPPKVILQKLQTDGTEWVVFASGTAAERFHRMMGKSWATRIKTAVIGESTAKIARKAGWRVVAKAKDVSAQAVLSAILRL